MMHLRRHLLVLAALAACAACTGAAETPDPASITPPLCSKVASFGNGATCTVSDLKLAACGAAAKRTCATGWLCFDAPEYANCGCATDADCDGRSAYVNAARTVAKKAPISSKCVQGRCSGQP